MNQGQSSVLKSLKTFFYHKKEPSKNKTNGFKKYYFVILNSEVGFTMSDPSPDLILFLPV